MPRIAISYRRADSAAITGRIFDRLSQHYGAGRVFMDIDEIPFGIDFRGHIAEVLAGCDAVVVIIGALWLGGDVRRIDEPTDPVRLEVQTALERGIPVIPVLVDRAAMPVAAALPEPLRPLAFRNACEIDTGRDFHAHVDRLIRSMDRIFAPAPVQAHGPASSPGSAPMHASPPADAAPRIISLPTALLTGFLALPQLTQFSQRTPLFLFALFVSTVGVATLVDRPSWPTTTRILTGMVVICGTVFVQSALALLRASFLDW